MLSIENERFVSAVDFLIKNGKVKNRKDFAEKVGFHHQIIYDIYKGKLKPSSELLIQAEKIFNVNKLFVLFGEGEMMKADSVDYDNSKPKVDSINEAGKKYETSNNLGLSPVLEESIAKMADSIAVLSESNKELVEQQRKLIDILFLKKFKRTKGEDDIDF